MNQNHLVLVFLSLCIILAVTAGCTSTTPSSQAAPQPTTGAENPAVTHTGSPVASPSVTNEDTLPFPADVVLLDTSHFPPGFTIIYKGEMLPPEENCTAGTFCYLAGYSISVSKGDIKNSTIADQSVMLYTKNATPDTIDAVFKDQLPDIAAANLTALSAPSIGDASAVYRFSFPPATGSLNGYIFIYGKGRIYEIIMITGPEAGETLLYELAGTSSAKLP